MMKWNSRLTAQMIGGALVGYAFYLIGGAAGVVTYCPHGGVYDQWWKVCMWGVAAYAVGVAVGVYLFGRLFKVRGSLGLTSLGSALGGAGVLAFLFSPAQVASCLLASFLAPLLATIGFHLRRLNVVQT